MLWRLHTDGHQRIITFKILYIETVLTSTLFVTIVYWKRIYLQPQVPEVAGSILAFLDEFLILCT